MAKHENASARGLTFTRALLYALASFALAVLQSTLGQRIGILGAPPQLTLALTASAAYLYGSLTGGTVGLISGIFTEALGATGVSVLPLLYCLIGWFGGLISRGSGSSGGGKNEKNALGLFIALSAAGIAGVAVTLVRLTLGAGRPNLALAIIHIALPELLSTLIYGIPTGLISLFIYHLISRKKE